MRGSEEGGDENMDMEPGGAYSDIVPPHNSGIDVHGNELPGDELKSGLSQCVLPDTYFSPQNTHTRVSSKLVDEIRLRLQKLDFSN